MKRWDLSGAAPKFNSFHRMVKALPQSPSHPVTQSSTHRKPKAPTWPNLRPTRPMAQPGTAPHLFPSSLSRSSICLPPHPAASLHSMLERDSRGFRGGRRNWLAFPQWRSPTREGDALDPYARAHSRHLSNARVSLTFRAQTLNVPNATSQRCWPDWG